MMLYVIHCLLYFISFYTLLPAWSPVGPIVSLVCFCCECLNKCFICWLFYKRTKPNGSDYKILLITLSKYCRSKILIHDLRFFLNAFYLFAWKLDSVNTNRKDGKRECCSMLILMSLQIHVASVSALHNAKHSSRLIYYSFTTLNQPFLWYCDNTNQNNCLINIANKDLLT